MGHIRNRPLTKSKRVAFEVANRPPAYQGACCKSRLSKSLKRLGNRDLNPN